MIAVDYLRYQKRLKTRTEDGKRYIFDPIRRKWLIIQPEELVRLLTIEYLIDDRRFNKNHIAVEKLLIVNERRKRCDILVYADDNAGKLKPLLLVECKAPAVPISEATFRQIASYNLPLRVRFLLVTNGRQTYCCEMNYETESFEFLQEVPSFRMSDVRR